MLFSSVVDLSHPLYLGMPNVGGLHVASWPVKTFAATRVLSQGRAAFESRMMLLPEHCGTHIDVPRHFDENGTALSEIPLDRLALPGQLLDLRHVPKKKAITVAHFEEAEKQSGRRIGPDAAVICWTGSDRDRGKADWMNDRPFIPTETARWLVDRGMLLFCTDLMGMDDPAEWWWPTHDIWLKNNVCMVQQLCNLDQLVDKQFIFVAFPIKMRDGTGCPVRAAALVI
jgi:arylformamidase